MNVKQKAILSAVVFCSAAGLTAFAVRQATIYRLQYQSAKKPTETNPPKPEEQKSPAVPAPEQPVAVKDLCKTSSDGVLTACIGRSGPIDEAGNVEYENPTYIYGTTTAFENTAQWKVVDGKGTTISKGYYTVASPDVGVPGPFSAWLFYDESPKTATGSLMVFEASAKDGQPIHQVLFPLTFRYMSGKMKGCDALSGSQIPVFWSNVQKQKNASDCTEVFSVTHTVCGDASSNQLIAVHELLKGPTPWEKSKGYTTNLPDGLLTPEIRHNAQGKFLDFASGFEGVAGSCRVGAIRAQFEKTVQAGIGIGVRGDANSVLQP